MPGSKPTIYDVAREAGVSIATVSRVLNASSKVNVETRTLVLAAIDRLGFVPKAEFRARALMSTNRIGVMIPFFTVPSFVQRLRGIASVLSKENYEMVIYPVDSHTRMMGYLETLPLNRNLDGLIIVSQAFDGSVARRLMENRLETVLIEYSNPDFCAMQIDDERGGYIAANYLLSKGHDRFSFLGGANEPEFGVDPINPRLKGFRQRLSEAELTLPDEAVRIFVSNPRQTLEELLRTVGCPLAMFVATDIQAIAMLKEVRQLNLRVPQDVAIMGFDDIDMAEYVGLTTIRQPLDESGRIAVELLLSRLHDPERPVQHIQLPLSVIERETA